MLQNDIIANTANNLVIVLVNILKLPSQRQALDCESYHQE